LVGQCRHSHQAGDESVKQQAVAVSGHWQCIGSGRFHGYRIGEPVSDGAAGYAVSGQYQVIVRLNGRKYAPSL